MARTDLQTTSRVRTPRNGPNEHRQLISAVLLQLLYLRRARVEQASAGRCALDELSAGRADALITTKLAIKLRGKYTAMSLLLLHDPGRYSTCLYRSSGRESPYISPYFSSTDYRRTHISGLVSPRPSEAVCGPYENGDFPYIAGDFRLGTVGQGCSGIPRKSRAQPWDNSEWRYVATDS